MTSPPTSPPALASLSFSWGKIDLFPENFSYVGDLAGDSLKVAEPLDGPIMKGYSSLARESNMWLSLGGFQEKGPDDAHLCSAHVVIDDAGNIRRIFRTIHLFDVDVPGSAVYKESSFTEAGKEIVAVDNPFGRLGLTICYDLRFPELYQQLRFHHNAQVLLVPAAFTKPTGQAHREILLRVRAIETQCYVIAAAQAGKHNGKRESYGDTLIIDPWGKVCYQIVCQLALLLQILISHSLIQLEQKCRYPRQQKKLLKQDLPSEISLNRRKTTEYILRRK